MASKRLDDLDWDHSLDYDFDDPFAPISEQKKRGVITRVATNFTDGVKDAFKTPSTLRTMASNMLPKGYGTAINFGAEVYREVEELHNIARKELEPSLPAMRRITQRHLPKVKKYAPRSVSDKLEAFSKESGYKGPSEAQRQEDTIKAALSEVFEVQVEADAQRGAEDRIERTLQHAQNMRTSRDQLRALEITQQGVLRLVDYQDTITNRYQKKSLELQTRHYLLARDQARVQNESIRRMHAQLEMIAKNSAMPDIAKQDMRHTASQSFRNRLLGSMQDSAGRFAQNYMSNMFKRVRGQVQGLAGGVGMAADQMDGMGGMGNDLPLLEMLSKTLGTGAVELLTRMGGPMIRNRLGRLSPGMAQQGGFLHRIITSFPEQLNQYARAPTQRGGTLGLLEELFKGTLPTRTMDPQIGRHGLADMDEAATFDKLTRQTIIEIIPGLLSRIEHNTARVLDPEAKRQIYNFDRRRFGTIEEASEDMSNRIMTRETRASTKQMVNSFIDDLVGDQPISDKTRGKLFRQILMDSGNSIPFSVERFISPAEKTPELDTEAKLELGRIFSQTGVLKDGRRDQVWWADRSDSYRSINFGAVAPIHAAGVYRDVGMRDLLKDQDLIEEDGFKDNLNLKRILDMIEQADYGDIKVKEQTAVNKVRDLFGKKVGEKFGFGGPEVGDLYRKGGEKPVLLIARLQANAYRDATTGQPLRKWEDIKGPVYDMTLGRVVLTADELHGEFTQLGKPVRFSLRTATSGGSNWADGLGKKQETPKTASRSEGPSDVLNAKGEVVMTGLRIKAGKYFDQMTGDPINSVDDIKGPVVDEDGRTVVTADDIAATLTDKSGKPLNGATNKMKARFRSVRTVPTDTPSTSQVFGQSESDASSIGGSPDVAIMDNGELLRLNSEQVELLKIIADSVMAISEGGLGGGGGEGTPGEGGARRRRGFLDSIALGGVKGAWWGAKAAGRGTWWWTKKVGSGVVGTVGGAVTGAGSIARGGLYRIGGALQGIKDIYVQGKREPVLTAELIRLGRYRDINTRKNVRHWNDISGPVEDKRTGETVLDQDDYDAGIYVKGPSGLTRLATKSIKGFGSAVLGFYGNVAALPFRAATTAVKAVGQTMKWLTNKQVDVYVKGEKEPRLKATKMKTGRYYNAGSKKTGKRVRTYEDIHGEIKELAPGSNEASKDDKTVIYEEEIHDPGLSNRWGMTLRTPFSRLVGAIGGAAISLVKGAGALFGGAMRGYGKLFGGLMGFGGAALGAPFKFLGALLNPFEKHGAKQVDLLEQIRDLLDARLPGSKPRSGSWQEQFAKKAEKKKEEAENKRAEERDRKWGLGGIAGFFRDKIGGLFGSRGDEDEDDDDGDDGDTTIIAGGGDGGDGKKKGKRGPRKTGGRLNRFRRNRRAKKLRAGRAKRPGVGRAGPGMMGRGIRVGAPAAMAATLLADPVMGAAGLDEDSSVRSAVNTGVSTAATVSTAAWLGGKLGLGALGAKAGVAGMAAVKGVGAVAGGILGAPVLVPLAIAAAVGGIGYMMYRDAKYGRPTPPRRFRYLQYGVSPGDTGHNKKIFQLENLLKDHVVERNGALDLSNKANSGGKDLSVEQIHELFGLDDGWFSNKENERRAFNLWFDRRFKPIFLTWVAGVRAEDPTLSILDADDKLTGEKLDRVLDKAWGISKSLYNLTASPFPGEMSTVSVSEIEEAYLLAKKEVGKTEGERSRDKWRRRGLSVLKYSSPFGYFAAKKLDDYIGEGKDKKDGAEELAKKFEENTGEDLIKLKGAVGVTAAAGHLLTAPLASLSKITSLASVRYKTYGAEGLDVDRVRALAALETLVLKNSSISQTGNIQLSISVEALYDGVAGLFGLTPRSPKDRARWAYWYGHRFLPTLSVYVAMVKRLAPSADLQQPERVLKADQQLQVAQEVMNAKGPDGRSVWSYAVSPWSSDETLPTRSGSIAGTLLVLKKAVEKQAVHEPSIAGADAEAEKNKSFLDKLRDGAAKTRDAIGNFLLGEEGNRNFLGKAVDRVRGGAQALVDNSREAVDRAARGDYGGAAMSAFQANTAFARHVTGIGRTPELKIAGNAKQREALLISEAIKAGITDPEELAMLLGQVAAETGAFKQVTENLNYRPEVAYKLWPNRFRSVEHARSIISQGVEVFADYIYGDRMGNTKGTGDGYKYRGRGLIQLTGKENYLNFERATGIKVVDNPDIVAADPRIAAMSAIHYWKTRVRGKANVKDLNDVTRKINGGLNGLEHRRSYVASYMSKFAKMTAEDILNQYAPSAQEGMQSSASVARESGAPAAPVTTTTTANGASGGVGPVEASVPPTPSSPPSVQPIESAPPLSGTAASAIQPKEDTPDIGQLATPAPQLESASSLDASAERALQETRAQEEMRQRQAVAEEARRREVEVQNRRTSEIESRQYYETAQILHRQLATQERIEKNTADTVGILRDLLRSTNAKSDAASSQTQAAPTSTTPRARPIDQRPMDLPVDVRYSAGH